jgi:hypothetical protein
VPVDVRAMVELATHTDHLAARARAFGERWVACGSACTVTR